MVRTGGSARDVLCQETRKGEERVTGLEAGKTHRVREVKQRRAIDVVRGEERNVVVVVGAQGLELFEPFLHLLLAPCKRIMMPLLHC